METNKFNSGTADSAMENEQTIMENQTGKTEQPKEGSKKNTDARGTVVAGAAGGILLAGLSSFLVASSIDHEEPKKKDEGQGGDEKHEVDHNHYADETIHMATGVNDNMSFNEAFAAARAEVGAGGAFVWRGHVYGTYYATEWNSMTPAERAEYESHFSWANNHTNTPSNEVADNTNKNEEVLVTTDNTEDNDNKNDDNNNIVINDNTDNEHIIEEPVNNELNVVTVDPNDVTVQAIGYDEDLDMNVAIVDHGGTTEVLVDVDIDNTFDLSIVDANSNGEIDDGEIRLIGNEITTDDLLGGVDLVSE